MPNREYARAMSKYNLWQNENLTQAADQLSDDDRKLDRQSFFGSIQQTFSHVLWADQLWLSRFTETEPPSGGILESIRLFEDWNSFTAERKRFDQVILNWAQDVQTDWFEGDLTWFSGAVGREVTKPKSMLVLQLFNHQTHHRGQIHAMLTAAGVKPGDTDVPFMPEEYQNM
jgi:uncharacterized damage-inducible protein DinB